MHVVQVDLPREKIQDAVPRAHLLGGNEWLSQAVANRERVYGGAGQEVATNASDRDLAVHEPLHLPEHETAHALAPPITRRQHQRGHERQRDDRRDEHRGELEDLHRLLAAAHDDHGLLPVIRTIFGIRYPMSVVFSHQYACPMLRWSTT